MSVFAVLPTILFLELLALYISFCSGGSDVGFIKSEKLSVFRLKQDLKDPSNSGVDFDELTGDVHELHRRTLKTAGDEYETYEGPKNVGIKQLPWKNLQYLDLRSNLFEGPVPAPPPNMKVFLISNNNLTGGIPHLICNTSTMEVLDLSNNGLSGTIPECLGYFSNSLRVLDLQKNRLHGTIPRTFSKGNTLRTLNFNGNGLEGSVPLSLVNCTMLEVLDLGNNNIKDTFPQWLGHLRELQVLVLRSNKFYAFIGDPVTNYSFSKLRIFDLSNNNFGGPLPSRYFENMKSMMDVGGQAKKQLQYMGETYYEDSVTLIVKKHEVELVKILTIFTTIDLSNNSFHGEIPALIGNLQSLRLLNLSQNILTSNIPSSLENLTVLESLDLSSNKLEGKIPWQLTRLTFLAVLNLSENQLVGSIPKGNQFDTFSNDSYSRNLGLCGFPLSNKCTIDEPSQPSLSLGDDTESGYGFGWKVVLMGYGSGTVLGMVIGYLVFSTRQPQWLVRMVEGKQHTKVRRLNNKHKGRRN